MVRRYPVRRWRDEDEPASWEVSRLLVAGFLIAALAGLLTGLGWMAWTLLQT